MDALTRRTALSGDLEGAERRLRRAAAAGSPESRGWLGLVLKRLGRQGEALPELRRAVEAFPRRAWLRGALGETLRELGARRRGYAEVQGAVRLDPGCRWASAFLDGPEGRHQAWVRGCRGGAARAAGDLERAEEELRRAVDLDVGCGWAWGWLGEVLLRRGRPEEALEALDRCSALFPEWGEVFQWRGEARRLLGRPEEAFEDLERALLLGQRSAELHLSRGLLRAAMGDPEGQVRELTEAVRLSPSSFRERADALPEGEARASLRAVLARLERSSRFESRARRAEASGERRAALSLAGAALEADPGHDGARRLRARLFLAEGRLSEAHREAEELVRRAPGPAHYALRAEVSQRLGYLESALSDLSVALSLDPSPAVHRWRAQAFLGMRHYDLALQDITSALELEPDDAPLYDLRAHVNLLLGRGAEAREDIERALALSPREAALRLRLAQVLALAGRFREAQRAAASVRRRSPAWAEHVGGYVDCLEGRWARASGRFERALRLSPRTDGNLRSQARLYGTVAKAMASGIGPGGSAVKKAGKDAKDRGRVYLCGLGVFPPQTATMEVLRAIQECDVIFNNLPGIGISEFLGLFCRDRRPVAFRYEQDARLCADLILSEARPGRTVGFVTFGHPLLFGPLSREVIQRCRSQGVACRAFGAVSSIDAVLAASGQILGFSYGGFQLFETTGSGILDEIARANERLPLVVYFADGMGEQWLESLARILRGKYEEDHACLLYGPRHELWETQQEKVALKDLAAISHHRLAQGILFVPPR